MEGMNKTGIKTSGNLYKKKVHPGIVFCLVPVPEIAVSAGLYCPTLLSISCPAPAPAIHPVCLELGGLQTDHCRVGAH